MATKVFSVTLTYFKPNGKYYTDTVVQLEAKTLDEDCDAPYMYDIFDQVRARRSIAALPGLQSGSWDGPILVDCEEGYPGLIMPE